MKSCFFPRMCKKQKYMNLFCGMERKSTRGCRELSSLSAWLGCQRAELKRRRRCSVGFLRGAAHWRFRSSSALYPSSATSSPNPRGSDSCRVGLLDFFMTCSNAALTSQTRERSTHRARLQELPAWTPLRPQPLRRLFANAPPNWARDHGLTTWHMSGLCTGNQGESEGKNSAWPAERSVIWGLTNPV